MASAGGSLGPAKETQALLGTLLVAWSFIASLLLVLSSAIYYRTGDINVILAYLGAPFLVGTSIFLLVGLVRFMGRANRAHAVVDAGPQGLKRRRDIHGRRGR